MSEIFPRIFFLFSFFFFFMALLSFIFFPLFFFFELFTRYWIGPGEEPACYMVTIGNGREVGFLFRFLLSYRGACLDWNGVYLYGFFSFCSCRYHRIYIRFKNTSNMFHFFFNFNNSRVTFWLVPTRRILSMFAYASFCFGPWVFVL